MELDKRTEELFQGFIGQLQRAKAMEEEAKTLKEKVKEEAGPLMLAMDMKSFNQPGVGTMSYVDGTSTSFDQNKLRSMLLEMIPAEKVAYIMDSCKKVSKYLTVQFKAEKAGAAS